MADKKISEAATRTLVGADVLEVENDGEAVDYKTTLAAIVSFAFGNIIEKSADPSNPAEGSAVLWMSDGTGSGGDGDILLKVTAGGVTKFVTLFDFSVIP